MDDENKNVDKYLIEDESINKKTDDLDVDNNSQDELNDLSENEEQLNFGLDKDDGNNADIGFHKEKEDDKGKKDKIITINKSKMVLIKKLLENIKENNDRLIQILSVFISDEDIARISIGQMNDNINDEEEEGISAKAGKIIEGVFDGESMIGPDGKQYSVPANYASKSKLVEGDILKLTITDNGTFVYKQIGPIERIRQVGKIEKNSEGNFIVRSNNKKWRILTASVTYFKGNTGDEAVILIPKTGESQWSAVENIIRNRE